LGRQAANLIKASRGIGNKAAGIVAQIGATFPPTFRH